MNYSEIQTGRVYILRSNDVERVVVVKMKIEKEIKLRRETRYFPAWRIENGWLDMSSHFFPFDQVEAVRKIDNIICEANTFKNRKRHEDRLTVNPSQLTPLKDVK